MTIQLLAVDDSATMRKVYELAFAGEDITVRTVPNSDAALAALVHTPDVVLVDTHLEGDDGYALAAEIRKRAPKAALVLLASKHHPYDAARGGSVGADDCLDKPFDTNGIIDRVKKAITQRASSAPSTTPTDSVPPPSAVAPSLRSVPPPPPLRVAEHPAAARSVTPPSGIATTAHIATTAMANGNMPQQLRDLGLSQSQIDAVLALSRDVIERVVWEVVPPLAETLIREEIARLTAER